PLNNAIVHMESDKKDTIAKGKTNINGDFEMVFSNRGQPYTIKVNPESNATTNVSLLTREGREIAKMQKSSIGNEFGYKLLKSDIVTMNELAVEDITLKYEKFSISDNLELVSSQ